MTDDQGPDAWRGRDETANCEETVHRLYHFLDGELTESRRQAISAHLDSCGDCLDAVDFEAELRRVVADRCRDRVPQALVERIADALRHEEQHPDAV
jgi:mycothiol system anti-sigma-R factor